MLVSSVRVQAVPVVVREREREVIFIFAGNHMAGRSICELRKGKCSWGSSGALGLSVVLCSAVSSLHSSIQNFN